MASFVMDFSKVGRYLSDVFRQKYNDLNHHLQLCNYTIEKILGVGGNGMVFAVFHNTIHSKSAIKIIDIQDWECGSELREINAHQRVSNHNCIVTMFDYCVDMDGSGVRKFLENEHALKINMKKCWDLVLLREKAKRNQPFLVIRMELCDSNLLSWIQNEENRLPRETWIRNRDWELNRLTIFRQVLEGILHIHSNNILHRDIKPENIFVDKKDMKLSIRVGDFGSAINHADHSDQLTHSSKQGTPLYWAPELAYGRKYGPQVDLYSLGLILAEIMFDVDGKDRCKFIDDVKHTIFPDSPTNYICNIDRVKSLVLTMTSKDPIGRKSLQYLICETDKILGFVKYHTVPIHHVCPYQGLLSLPIKVPCKVHSNPTRGIHLRPTVPKGETQKSSICQQRVGTERLYFGRANGNVQMSYFSQPKVDHPLTIYLRQPWLIAQLPVSGNSLVNSGPKILKSNGFTPK